MKSIRLFLVGVIALALIAASIPFWAPVVPEGFPPIFVARGFFFTVLGIGAAVLLLKGLTSFKPEFKKAYKLLCAGAVIHALGGPIALFLFLYLPAMNTAFLILGSDLPYLIGTILIFLGAWQFTHVLGLKKRVNNLRLLLITALGVTLLSWLVPHAAKPPNEFVFDLLVSVIWLECYFGLLSAVLFWQLRNNINRVYVRSITWLSLMVISTFIASCAYLYIHLNDLFASTGPVAMALLGISDWLFILHILFFVFAAYSFSKITHAEEKRQKDGSIFDVITYLTSLASVPLELDPILDDFRIITATHKAGEPLDAATLTKLASVYQRLETHIVEHDRLRTYTRDEIRRNIEHRFDQPVFEPLFTAGS